MSLSVAVSGRVSFRITYHLLKSTKICKYAVLVKMIILIEGKVFGAILSLIVVKSRS